MSSSHFLALSAFAISVANMYSLMLIPIFSQGFSILSVSCMNPLFANASDPLAGLMFRICSSSSLASMLTIQSNCFSSSSKTSVISSSPRHSQASSSADWYSHLSTSIVLQCTPALATALGFFSMPSWLNTLSTAVAFACIFFCNPLILCIRAGPLDNLDVVDPTSEADLCTPNPSTSLLICSSSGCCCCPVVVPSTPPCKGSLTASSVNCSLALCFLKALSTLA